MMQHKVKNIPSFLSQSKPLNTSTTKLKGETKSTMELLKSEIIQIKHLLPQKKQGDKIKQYLNK